MHSKKIQLLLVCFTLLALLNACFTEEQQKTIDRIKAKYYVQKAQSLNYYSEEYQRILDKAILADSTYAYAWQQKAMPFIKRQMLDSANIYVDKAVKYDSLRYMDYRGFCRLYFLKNPDGCISDLEWSRQRMPGANVMDHSYLFHIGLAHLVKGNYEEAKQLIAESIDLVANVHGEEWVSPSEYFYLAHAEHEMNNKVGAIAAMEKATANYPHFTDAYYYLSKWYSDEAKSNEMIQKFDSLASERITFPEHNAQYVDFPYQQFSLLGKE